MKQRLLTTELGAQYVQKEWDGENTSGWKPIGDSVLVLLDEAAETAGEHGLIHLPTDIKERHNSAAETGTIIDMGDGAFVRNAARTGPWSGTKPKIGDHVIFARYAGRETRGADGSTYRLMSDDCIAAVEVVEGEPEQARRDGFETRPGQSPPGTI